MEIDPWFFAVWTNDVDRVQQLAPVNTGRSDETGQTALMYAARKGFAEIVQLLAAKEAKIRDHSGRTALMLAVIFQQPDVVGLLTQEAGIQDDDGWTAAMHCVSQNDVLSLDYVVDSELLICNVRGQSLLHLAVELQNTDFVEILVQKRALLGLRDSQGCTALFYAVQQGSAQMVRLLLPEAGIQDNHGRCALQLAISLGNQAIADILLPEEQRLLQRADGGSDDEGSLGEQHRAAGTEPQQSDQDEIRQEEVDAMMQQLGIDILRHTDE